MTVHTLRGSCALQITILLIGLFQMHFLVVISFREALLLIKTPSKALSQIKINPVDIFFCLLAVLEPSSISLKQPLGFVPSSHDLSVEELGETALI